MLRDFLQTTLFDHLFSEETKKPKVVSFQVFLTIVHSGNLVHSGKKTATIESPRQSTICILKKGFVQNTIPLF
jgi:hypothetical protein